MTAENKVKKIFSFISIILIIVSVVLVSAPHKVTAYLGIGDTGVSIDPITGAQTTATAVTSGVGTGAGVSNAATNASGLGIAVNTWYGKLLDQVLMAIARKVLQEITKSTVNWINSGFHGSPLFVQNPESFFTDIAKSEIKTSVDMFGYDASRFPFGRNFALNTINSYKSTLQNNLAYTLSLNNTGSTSIGVGATLTPTQLYNYQNNFNYGGWNTFLINTQYPQNNYIGFQFLAGEDLATKIQGTAQPAVQKVKETLQQGQGFLSPQICPSNPSYNNMVNEFQKPQFDMAKFSQDHPFSKCTGITDDTEYENCTAQWNDDLAVAKREWGQENTCPGGLQNTTPGAVVANQITTALGSDFRQTELGAAMGNSLSSIFDALLNKFLGDGLSSLASTKNPNPPVDNWTYEGQSLSGPNDADWAGGADQEVILKDFRMLIEGKTTRTFNAGEQLRDDNGDLKFYTGSELVICKGDEVIESDANGNAIKVCTRGDVLTDASGAQRTHGKGDPTLADGGEVVSWIGDTTAKTGGDYFPGDITNTTNELAIMDNTSCNTTDTGCVSGILQVIPRIMDATQTLDQCTPGPDKGWEKRLDSEYDRQNQKLSSEAALKDEETSKAATAMQKDLKFAVTSFKDWITAKMESTLPGSMLYLDAINSINDTAQQLQDLSASKKRKSQALARVKAIDTNLKTLWDRLAALAVPLTQPTPGSAYEKLLISYKKQYDATKADISSQTTLENTKNQLATAMDKLNNLNTNLIPQCAKEGKAATPTETEIRNGETLTSWDFTNPEFNNKNFKEFCAIPINSGYSHGETIRHSDAGARVNGQSPAISDWHNWYVFRNSPWTWDTVNTESGTPKPIHDEGDPGYEDLPMVNAIDIEGDGTVNNWITIKIGCNTIMKSSNTDYTHAGDLTQ